MTETVRVRFAPSPTGYLHVGGARTALFNWLLARRHGGTFVLRIEDTDVERSSEEMVTGILDGLRWLGLDWDEGPLVGGPHAPYFQSERLERYRALAERLAADGHAYYCYCTPETLQRKRAEAEARGASTQYDRTCLRLAPEEIARLSISSIGATGAARAIRFKVPEGVTRFADLVHGDIEFDRANIEDFVILRSDRHPTYHLSVVADDVDMGITQVIRGDDHISNTPKHVLLFEALGAAVPKFAHVPLILGTDKKRLSKRHGATSVMEYARLGYLPEAMVNFLALLGWSPGDTDQELFSRDELIAAFALDGISGGNAVFNPEKLDWMNGQHIMRLPAEEIATRLEPWLRGAGLWDDAFAGTGVRRAWLLQLIELLKPRAKRLDDFVAQARPFLTDIASYDQAVAKKHWSAPDVPAQLDALAARLDAVDPFEPAALEQALRGLAEERGLKAGNLIHATRLALTGAGISPGLFEVMALLGRDQVRQRLARAIGEIHAQHGHVHG